MSPDRLTLRCRGSQPTDSVSATVQPLTEGELGSNVRDPDVVVRRWDAFISYANEDGELVAKLAQALRGAGLQIWIDHQELRVGDSLSEKIDEGLAASRFGIVVLSPSFIAKRWPRQELNGLMAREEGGRKVILPIWHDINKETLSAYSPVLADRLASSTDQGVAAVAHDIVQVIVEPASGSPSVDTPTLGRRFIELLDSGAEPKVVRTFLATHRNIPARAVGVSMYSGADRDAGDVRVGVDLGGFELDLCIMEVQPSSGTKIWSILQLAESSGSLFGTGSEPIASIERRVAVLEAFRRWIPRNSREASHRLPGISSAFHGIVVAGRRTALAPEDSGLIRRYNAELIGITLRTYDWLVEAAVSLS